MSRRGHNFPRLGTRPHLRLVVDRPEPPLFGMHPSLPSTLVFAAFSITALAVATMIDAASAVARTAAAMNAQIRAARLG